ncbi:Glycosyltransferase involved in cell wall bisynthesis [Dyadobacter sp. SG02]|uniref:glycosyltransferase family 2 protein n=1 Tax=Dyadobacter sp. SG02 TaxID=1855291 RepID=UPI0008C9A152|nr:glycosyltransferase family 2 protein [Dyadobacter sp. SG02]SEJ39220.1 Glycosyltransferase involved in cell wall bisynthesis [Dyadobacter sp. SG02]
MISVAILTKNEEQDLPLCLASVKWSNDIHILDSGSTDRTIEIGKARSAKIWYNQFESFGKQRNYALDHIPFRYDWILFLDADEVMTQDFFVAMRQAILSAGPDVAGFYCCWKMIYENKWLKHCDNFPRWQFRLLRRDRARFKDFGHGQKEDKIIGRIEYLREPYLHYGFSKGWSHWINRHNRYSDQEASSRIYNRPPFGHIFSKHSSESIPALKSWLSDVPGWPLLRFVQAYLFNLGFLEGMPGLIYCVNMAYYEFLVQIKMRELRGKKHQKNGQPHQSTVVNPTIF